MSSYMQVDEKSVQLNGLPTFSQPPPTPKSGCKIKRVLRPVLAGLLLGALAFCPVDLTDVSSGAIDSLGFATSGAVSGTVCAQPDALSPSDKLWRTLGDEYTTPEFRTRAIDWLAGAVRVPTESYDKMAPVGEDPRWEAFAAFQPYLAKAFPQVHATFKLTRANTYGLIYEWPGTDSSLKPILLMAHQDVVPVDPNTVDKWTHPPYSGHYDGERIWGRGSSDDKSGLIGIMSTLETLIEHGFKPARGIVLSFGFDEEASGLYGATENAKKLRELYGKNAFELIVDEGGGFSDQYGSTFAVPGVAEKGYLDVRVMLHAPGGHSSIPPTHTSIGMLSRLLVEYENHPYTPKLTRGTPVYETVQCLAEYAPGLSSKLRKAIKKAEKSDKALAQVESLLFEVPMWRALVGTTQAIDLIQGGVKTNALPEESWAVVNHRIDIASSVDAVKKSDTALLKELAAQFNLSYTAFGERLTSADAPSSGSLELSDAWGTALEPAPVTATSGKAYKLLAGTIRATYDRHRESDLNKDEIVVAPGIMTGNTDTRYYWDLSRDIFRYNHHNAGKGPALSGVHTVNESILVDSFLEMIEFFTTLILNANEARF